MKKSLRYDVPEFEGPEAALESMLIDDYLRQHGFTSIKDLCKLPVDEAKRIMIESCRYASLKLAEVESRDTFQREIHVGD